MTDEIKVGRLARDMVAAEVEFVREADKPARLTFPASSEMPVQRWFGEEVLRHDEKAIRMDRLKGGAAPLLFNHNWDDPVGMIDGARVKDGRLWVDAHFFATDRAKEVQAMVEGGMRNVSIGYELYTVEEDKKNARYTATDWGVLEVSFATVPADPSVGVGRSAEQDTQPTRVVRDASASQPAAPAASLEKATMADTQAAAGANADTNTLPAQPRQGPSAMDFEKARVRAIENLCKANKIDDKVRDHWVGTGLGVEEITEDLLQILEERGKRNPQVASRLGLTEKETNRFSLFRAIQATRDNNWTQAGFELECSREVAKRLGRNQVEPNRFLVPFEVQERQVPIPRNQRDLTVGTTTAGGFLVETQNQSFIEVLRNRSVAYRMGARRLSGLEGNVTIPRQTGAATAVWMANEGSTLTESQQVFAQMALSPKTVGAYTEVSRLLMMQSSPAAEGIVTADLAAVCSIAYDLAVLSGSGSSGQPTGITNTAGIGSVTGTSLDYADVLEFQTDVAGANVMPVAGGYVTTPAVASLMMQRVKFSSTASPLWEGNVWDGTMAGFNAMTSLQMSAATMLFGDWAQVIVAEWGTLEIEVNPYANFQSAITGIRAIVSMDCGLRYAGAFSLASSIT